MSDEAPKSVGTIYRDASDPPPAKPFPPRTKSPSMPGMASSFDKLVEANLQVMKTLRLAIPILVTLTASAAILAVFSSWSTHIAQHDMQLMVTNILHECYPREQKR